MFLGCCPGGHYVTEFLKGPGDLNVPECPRQVCKFREGFVGGNVVTVPWVYRQVPGLLKSSGGGGNVSHF